MSFDAGTIEARADLDRTPFQQGLRLLKAEGEDFQRNKLTARADLDTREATAKVTELRRKGGEDIHANLQLDTAGADAKLLATKRLAASIGTGGAGGRGGGVGSGSGGLFGKGGFFDRHSGPGLLGSAVGFGLPLVGPAAALTAGAGASLLTPLTAGLAGVVPLAAAAKSSLTLLGKDVQTLTKYQQAYNAATTDKQRQTILAKEAQLWHGLDGPQRAALRNVQHLDDTWKHFQKQLQPTIFTDLADAAPLASKGLHLLEPTAKAAGSAIDDLEKRAQVALTQPFWHQFSDFLAKETPLAVNAFGTALGRAGTGVAHLAVDFAPLGHLLEVDAVKWATQFEQWTQGKGPGRFVTWVEQHGPQAAHELGQLGKGVGGLFKALTPVGMGELHALSDIINWLDDIEKINPHALTLIGGGIVTIMAGLRVGHAVSAGVNILRDLKGLGSGGGITGSGGALGKILGSGSRVATMNVEAGVVNVRGGIGTGGGEPIPGGGGSKEPEPMGPFGKGGGLGGFLKTLPLFMVGAYPDSPSTGPYHPAPGLNRPVNIPGSRQSGNPLGQQLLDLATGHTSGYSGEAYDHPGLSGINLNGLKPVITDLQKAVGFVQAYGSAWAKARLQQIAANDPAVAKALQNIGLQSRDAAGHLTDVGRAARQVTGATGAFGMTMGLLGGNMKAARAGAEGVKSALDDYIQKLREHNATTPQVVAHVQALERGFEAEAAQTLGSKSAADRLLASLHLLPRQARTLVKLDGVSEFQRQINRVDAMIAHVANTTANVNLLGSLGKEKQLIHRGNAAGGLISGPGSDTSDNLLRRVSPGEYIVRASRVRAFGVPFMDWLNGGPGTGGVSGYATGGMIAGPFGEPESWIRAMQADRRGGSAIYDAATARVFLSSIARDLTGLNNYLTQGAISSNDTALSLLRGLAGKIRSAHDPLIEFIQSRGRRLDKAAQATAQYGKALTAANDKLQNDLQARAGLVQAVQGNVTGFAAISGFSPATTGGFTWTDNPDKRGNSAQWTMPGSAQTLASWLAGQKQTISRFFTALRRLKADGLGAGLLSQLAQMPPDAGVQLAASINPSDIRDLNQTEASITATSASIARYVGSAVYGPAISSDRKQVAALLAEQKNAVATLRSIDRKLDKQAHDIGQAVEQAISRSVASKKNQATAKTAKTRS